MSALLRTTVGPASDDGGGDMREADRLCASFSWAFFECDKARFGIGGTSMLELLLDGRIPALVFAR
jgi:hypothetical protein